MAFQHSLALSYSGEAGGLNESMSDVFGSMFRQWEKKQDGADWLIGHDIMGPVSKQKGYIAHMANPRPLRVAAQPDHYYPNRQPSILTTAAPNLVSKKAATAIVGTAGKRRADLVQSFDRLDLPPA